MAAEAEASAQLEAARAAFASGRLDDAIAAFEAVIAAEPAHCRAHAGLARCRAARGDYDAAIALARRAVELGPDESWGHVALAIALYQAERFDELVAAASAIPEAALSDEQHGNVYAMLSYAFTRLGDHPDAIEDAARAAVRRAPDLAFAHAALASALVRQDQVNAARSAIERALELDPANATYAEQRDAIVESIAFCEEWITALANKPEPTATDLVNLGSFYASVDRFDEAIATYDGALALAPNDEFLPYLRARAVALRGPRVPTKKPRGSQKPKPKPKPKPRPKRKAAPAKKPKASLKPKPSKRPSKRR